MAASWSWLEARLRAPRPAGKRHGAAPASGARDFSRTRRRKTDVDFSEDFCKFGATDCNAIGKSA